MTLPGGHKRTRARRLKKQEIRVILIITAVVAFILVNVLAFIEGSFVRKSVDWAIGQFSDKEKREIWNELPDDTKKEIREYLNSRGH